MDRDSIREFLEKREKELYRESPIPKIKKDGLVSDDTRSKITKKKGLFGKVIKYTAAILVAFGLAFFLSRVYKTWKVFQEDKLDNVIIEVSRLTNLPEGEIPTVATVTNPELIKRQPFFKEALLGDKVLFYKQAKKAILYRPSTKKIISVETLN